MTKTTKLAKNGIPVEIENYAQAVAHHYFMSDQGVGNDVKSAKRALARRLTQLREWLNKPKATAVSFAIGDMVTPSEEFLKRAKNGEHNKMPLPHPCQFGYVVVDASADTGELLYAVNGVAWFSLKDWTFAQRATQATLDYAIEMNEDEGEDEEGE